VDGFDEVERRTTAPAASTSTRSHPPAISLTFVAQASKVS
jgi:hypothetical protein